MVAAVLIVAGAASMLAGSVMLVGWVSGKSGWFNAGVFDRAGNTKNDRQFMDLYFVAMVIAPLLGGAVLIVFGLRECL